MAASLCAPADGGVATDAPLGGDAPGTGSGGASGSSDLAGGGGVTGSGGVVGGGGVVGSGGTTTPWTQPPGCGDGILAAPERCDDGNNLPFDGCSSDCQHEPLCNGTGPCTSTCGDGLVVGEACDDGNTTPLDGCSATCTVEPGFTCTQPPLGQRILVPAIYRDFKFHTPPDFEGAVTGSYDASPKMVEPNLDAEGKPVYTGLTGLAVNVESKETFAQWYRSVLGVNHQTASKLALWDNNAGAYVNRHGAGGEPWPITDLLPFCGSVGYEALDANGAPIPCTMEVGGTPLSTDCDKARAAGQEIASCIVKNGTYQATVVVGYADGTPLFFPIDDDPFSAAELARAMIPSEPLGLYDVSALWPIDVDSSGKNRLHNFSFTSEIRYWFRYEEGASNTLNVTGDDDVWVFVNGKLAVDLGGIHTPVEGSVTLDATTAATYGLLSGNVYEVAVFQAERQRESSTFKLTLGGFNSAPSQCHRN